MFFLIVGLSNNKDKFEKLSKESTATVGELLQENFDESIKELDEKDIDSLKKVLQDQLNTSFIPIPKSVQNKILSDLEKKTKDSTAVKIAPGIHYSFDGDSDLDKFVSFQRKYPNSKIDVALDSLAYAKNFTNRFLYTRATAMYSFATSENSSEKYLSELLSYGSVSLFVFLPFFTLFLRFFYLRRKNTYVDHLIFVFHTQTVFFMLLSIVFLISFFTDIAHTWIILVLFLIYLFLAMKRFYNQGYLKTGIKFLMLNAVYLFMGSIGVVIVGLISFALY